MKALTKYNTLSEALAFNLTNEEIDEFGYFETLQKEEYVKKIYEKLMNNVFEDEKNVYEYKVEGTAKRYTANTRKYNQSEFELENKDSEFMQRTNSLLSVNNASKEKSLNIGNNAFSRFLAKDKTNIDYGVLERWIFNNALFYCHSTRIPNNYLPFFGDYSGTKPFNFISGVFTGLTYIFHTNSQYKNGKLLFSSFKDFRWLENKKTFTFTDDIIDSDIFEYANLIPNHTIGYLCKKEIYEEFIKEEPTFKEKCKTLDEIIKLEKKYRNKVFIFYRNINHFHMFFNNCFIHDLFCYDSGERFPLDDNGYIDYTKLDFRKIYTTGLGSANVNINLLTKLIDTQIAGCDTFKNEPISDKQGIPYQIDFTNTIFNKTKNTSTMTIKLGYTKIDNITYNDELIFVKSENNLLDIIDNKNETYTILFKKEEVSKDNILVSIKNTFTNETDIISYEMNFLADNEKEFIAYYLNQNIATVSESYKIKGYIYLERFDNFTELEINSLNDKDLIKSTQYLKQNIMNLSTNSTFNILYITKITATQNIVVAYINCITCNIEQQNLAATYNYIASSVKGTKNISFDIILDNDIIQEPVYNPTDGNNSNSGSGAGGGGGSGAGGGGSWRPRRDDDDGRKIKSPIHPGYEGKMPEPRIFDKCTLPPMEGDYANLADLYDFKTEITENTKEQPLPEPGQANFNYGHDYQGGFIYWQNNRYETNSPWLMPTHSVTKDVYCRLKNSLEEQEWQKLTSIYSYKYLNSFVHFPKDGSKPEGEVVNKDDKIPEELKNADKQIILVAFDEPNSDLPKDFNPFELKENIKVEYNSDGSVKNIKIRLKYTNPYVNRSGYIQLENGLKLCVFDGREKEPKNLENNSMLISEYLEILPQLYNLPELIGITEDTKDTISLTNDVLGNPQWTLNDLATIDEARAKQIGWIPTEITDVGNRINIIMSKGTENKQEYNNGSLKISYTGDNNKDTFNQYIQGAFSIYEKNGNTYNRIMISEPVNIPTNYHSSFNLNNLNFGKVSNGTPSQPSVVNMFDATITNKTGFYIQFQVNAYQNKLGARTHTFHNENYTIISTTEKKDLVEGSVTFGYKYKFGAGSDGKQKQLEMIEKLKAGKMQ